MKPRPISVEPADEEQRERDLYILRELISALLIDEESSDFSAAEREAFPEMFDRLDGPNAQYRTLTSKQRSWALSTAERLCINPVPPKYRKPIPRGREVPLPPALQNLPKRPPGRRL